MSEVPAVIANFNKVQVPTQWWTSFQNPQPIVDWFAKDKPTPNKEGDLLKALQKLRKDLVAAQRDAAALRSKLNNTLPTRELVGSRDKVITVNPATRKPDINIPARKLEFHVVHDGPEGLTGERHAPTFAAAGRLSVEHSQALDKIQSIREQIEALMVSIEKE